MSGVVKGIKKVFKKVTKFVKRYWKEIVVAAAVVFTAGAAMGAWGAAAGASSAAGGAAVGSAAAGSTAAAAAGGTAAAASGASGAILSGGTFASGATTGLAAAGTGAATGAAATGMAAGVLAPGGAAAGAAAAGKITTLGTVSVTGSAASAGGLTAAQSVGLAAASGAATGAPFSKGAAEAAQPGSQTQQFEQPQQATPGESIASTGNPNDVQAVGTEAAPTGIIGKGKAAVKKAWGGMSSFEKMMVLNTGVQMASAMTAPKQGDVPLGNQFYGRDIDNKGDGLAMDYDQSSGQFIPGGSQPQQAAPVGQMGQPASSSRPQFVNPEQVGAPAQSRSNERFLSANRQMGDEDSLRRRLDFITDPNGGRNG